MAELGRKFLYRIFCAVALIVTIYLLIDLSQSHTLDIKVMVLFGIIFSVILLGLFDWSRNYADLRKKEQELKIYKLYIKPMEEPTKDIRARQHEFDNHMNAILNMHVTIDNYDELVKGSRHMAGGFTVTDRAVTFLFYAFPIKFLPDFYTVRLSRHRNSLILIYRC